VTDNVEVRDNSSRSRYEILVDNELVGFSEYVEHGAQVDFVHTEIRDDYAGRGLASEVIRRALDDARRRGWHVLPYCRFVRGFMEKNSEYRDLVPADRRGRFGLA
jgi:predicted GNAT family acetyltransferase